MMVLELARSDVKSDCKDPIRKILLRSKRQSRTAVDSRAGGLILTSQKEAERSKQRPIRFPKMRAGRVTTLMQRQTTSSPSSTRS